MGGGLSKDQPGILKTFIQAILRKLKELGFWTMYVNADNDIFKNVIRMFVALAYVPVDEVHAAFNILSRHAMNMYPDDGRYGDLPISPFITYFMNTWMGPNGGAGGKFKLQFWNVRES